MTYPTAGQECSLMNFYISRGASLCVVDVNLVICIVLIHTYGDPDAWCGVGGGT
jgi:hypothetical protein